ncbi:hypothetical protein DIZ76_017817 [Coccidioides immitis]|nr:hypothetical protein DIZ76_017817 [Coccidioides immitis]
MRESGLRHLNNRRWELENKIFEAQRMVDRYERDLRRLQEEAEMDTKEQAAKGGWWAYIWPFGASRGGEIKDEHDDRRRRELHRKAAQRIKEQHLEEQRQFISRIKAQLQSTNCEIKKFQEEIEREEREKEKKRHREEEEKRWREVLKRQAEEEERRRREFQAQMGKVQKKSHNQSAKTQRQSSWTEQKKDTKMENARRQANRGSHATNRSTNPLRPNMVLCDHALWWPRVDGTHLCSRCLTHTTRFAFRCPRCNKVACASCRDILRGK